MIKKIIAFISGIGLFLFAKISLAFCPICTIAVGAGVGLSRWLGIDDTVTGIWVGGLIVSLIGWTDNWLKKKNFTFRGMTLVTAVVYYAAVAIPLAWTDIIGHPLNKLWGMDKLLLGMVVGSIGFLIAAQSYEIMKRRNGNKAHFPFQKIVMPVAMLVILGAVFYFITK